MSKVTVIQEAHDIRQTERLRNQRIVYSGHTAAHLCTGDRQYRDLVPFLVCLETNLHCMVHRTHSSQVVKADPR